MPPNLPNLVFRMYASVWQGTTIYVLGRIVGKNAQHNRLVVTQSEVVDPISYNIVLDGVVVNSGTLNKADVILNTLNTGSIWTYDKTGFNFIAEFDESLFPEVGEYLINIQVDLVSGSPVKGQARITSKENNTTPLVP